MKWRLWLGSRTISQPQRACGVWHGCRALGPWLLEVGMKYVRRVDLFGRLLDGISTVALTLLIVSMVDRCSQSGTLELPPIPAAGPDTGWHEALDAYGDFYFIDLPYSEMNDSQRDDANRFGRLYPEGKE